MNLDISYYVSVFLRRIYIMVIVAVGFTAAATYVALQLPAEYSSNARLLVESPQIPTNLATSTVQVATSEQLQIIQQRLLTRDNLLTIARQMNAFPQMGQMSADEIVAEMRSSTRINQSDRRSEATFVDVRFTGPNPDKAAAIVNEYVTRILEENRSLRTDLAEQTMDFFEQETQRLNGELGRRSEEIVSFKRQNADALPQSLQFRQDRRLALQERVNQIERELTLLDDQEARLEEVFKAGGQIDEATAESPEAQRLASLRADLDSALAVYSPTNPRVRLLEARIKQVEEQILASAEAGEDPLTEPEDPRLTMYNMQVSEIEARRQNLIDQRTFINDELVELNDSIERTPEISVAIESLERDYANIQTQYNQAASRLATAAQGERIELLSKGERITVIENASVPSTPTSPNRPMIAGAGAAAGVVLGTALIFLFELLNQSIRRPIDLERQLGVTPIATLPYIRTRREVIWKRLILIAIMAVVVIGGPAIIYAVHTYFMPIDVLVDRILDSVLD